jgi:hypothetical protein
MTGPGERSVNHLYHEMIGWFALFMGGVYNRISGEPVIEIVL